MTRASVLAPILENPSAQSAKSAVDFSPISCGQPPPLTLWDAMTRASVLEIASPLALSHRLGRALSSGLRFTSRID
jgi:hypothetical protein